MKKIHEKIKRFFSWHPEPKEPVECFSLFNPSHRKKIKMDIIRKFLDVHNWNWDVDENAFENGNSLHRVMINENQSIIYFNDNERYFISHPKFRKLMKMFGYNRGDFESLLKIFIKERFGCECKPLANSMNPFNTPFQYLKTII